MSFEDSIPNWIYIIFIAPIGIFVNQIRVKHSNRITVLETKQNLYEKKVDKICKSNEDLAEKVNQMIGRMDEHLKK